MLLILSIVIVIKCVHIETVYSSFGWFQSTTIMDPYITTRIYTTMLPTECKQSQLHAQHHFCDEYRAVVRAKVIKRFKGSSDYEIKILNVFQGPDVLITQTRLINNRLCPADLTPDNDTYIITGMADVDGTNFRTSQGNWIQKVDTLNVIQKIGLRSYYNEACGKCEIKSCSGADCSVIDKDACKMDVGWSESITNCYTRNSVCRRRIRCVWRSWNITKDENGRHFNRINCN